MGLWPVTGPPAPPIISSVGAFGIGAFVAAWQTGGPSGFIGTVANEIRFYPITIPEMCVVQKFIIGIGITSTGNIDCGLYDEAFTRVVSTGSTACGAANATQTIDCTDTVVGRGAYYLAHASSGAPSWSGSGVSVQYMQIPGGFQQMGTFPLPATSTPAAANFGTYVHMGIVVRQFST